MTREEAIEVQKWLGNNHFLFTKTFEDVKASTDMAIEALYQKEKIGWIPVSERLPEKEGRYLTTIFNEHDNKLRYIMICDYFSNGCWCPDDECASSNVIAWMPLPAPFESQESEDKE